MVRALTFAVALAFVVPGAASASDGILLLTHYGSATWNTGMGELAAKVDKKKPTELALGAATRATIEPAIERLTKRGVTSVTIVPLFIAAPASDQVSGLSLPARVSAGVQDATAITDLIISLAEEVSSESSSEVLVLMGQGGADWKVGLAPAAQSINTARRFNSVIQIDKSELPTPQEQAQLRSIFERAAAQNRRLVVVPLVLPSGGDPAIEQRMQGFNYTLAKRAVLTDDAFAAMIVHMTTPAQ